MKNGRKQRRWLVVAATLSIVPLLGMGIPLICFGVRMLSESQKCLDDPDVGLWYAFIGGIPFLVGSGMCLLAVVIFVACLVTWLVLRLSKSCGDLK